MEEVEEEEEWWWYGQSVDEDEEQRRGRETEGDELLVDSTPRLAHELFES